MMLQLITHFRINHYLSTALFIFITRVRFALEHFWLNTKMILTMMNSDEMIAW